MSLINDALKEAKQAQQEAAPPPTPQLQLRPIDPTQSAGSNAGLMWPTALLAVALLLLVLVWQLNHRSDVARPTEVQAHTAMPAVVAAGVRPEPAPVAPAPAPQPPPETAPAPPTASKAASTSGNQIAALPLSLEAAAVPASDEGMTNTMTLTEPPASKPTPPKLQGIMFSRTRPCAMISGKTLYVGDKLEGLRIEAIDRESVTLVGAGQTNVLSLAK